MMAPDNKQPVSEKGLAGYKEALASSAAGDGQVATDEYVRPVFLMTICSRL